MRLRFKRPDVRHCPRVLAPQGRIDTDVTLDQDASSIGALQRLVDALIGLVSNIHAFCRQMVTKGAQRIWRIAGLELHQVLRERQAVESGLSPDINPSAVRRRCSRADLDQREIVMILAARKKRHVGPVARHLVQAGHIPVKRGRRSRSHTLNTA